MSWNIAKSEWESQEVDEGVSSPANERPVMLIIAGYPAPGAFVPDLQCQPLAAIATYR